MSFTTERKESVIVYVLIINLDTKSVYLSVIQSTNDAMFPQKVWLQFFLCRDNTTHSSSIYSDQGLALETSALENLKHNRKLEKLTLLTI